MSGRGDEPLIIQGDRSILLEARHPRYDEARDLLARFAELVKSPEHIHTYRITPLSLWNAAAAGEQAEAIVAGLEALSRYPVPGNVVADIRDAMAKYGRLKLVRDGETLLLVADDPLLLAEVCRSATAQAFLDGKPERDRVRIRADARGVLKQALLKLGHPIEDLAGYVNGARLSLALRSETRTGGEPFQLRLYQKNAAEVFHAGGSARGGSGVIVLPCGAGKTLVGIAAMEKLQTHTLVLTTSLTAVRQWIRELLERTTLTPEQVGEYTGEEKSIRPVTITTYQILTWRKSRTDAFAHFGLFDRGDWGFIVYDEVHLLPAPVFRVTADIQARRRLGLTATLVREDEKEDDVFSLIGPKKYDVPWKELERQGWIATARCVEVRIALPEPLRPRYALADAREKFRLASENIAKFPVVESLIRRHQGEQILVIGQYLDQLKDLARRLDAPLITGATRQKDREDLYGRFRTGALPVLLVSKVGNFAIDLPDASVAIQVSGTFGSRQEEAQRLGRVLRPKRDGQTATFYSLVTRNTRDQEFAANRQLFLTEQGYSYEIVDAGSVVPFPAAATDGAASA